MNIRCSLFITLCVVFVHTRASARRIHRLRRLPITSCEGTAKYRIIFYNFLSSTGRFRNIVPAGGLNFSPLAAVTHDPRISLFTIRGFASSGLEAICENGNNAAFLDEARAAGGRVTSVVGGDGVIPGGNRSYVEVNATCDNSYLTVVSMIAPSPDWIVQINNFALVRRGRFIRWARGRLVAYDCGTDSGREFTDPANTTLDIPTVPVDNIVRLDMDETDRFDGRTIGFYRIIRMPV